MSFNAFDAAEAEEDLLQRALGAEGADEQEEEDESAPPMTGEDYLRRVRREAKRLDVVVAARKPRHPAPICPAKRPSSYVVERQDRLKLAPPEGFAPKEEWQRRQVASFSETRTALERHLANMQKEEAKGKIRKKPKMPAKENERGASQQCTVPLVQEYLIQKDWPIRSLALVLPFSPRDVTLGA